MNKKGKKWNHSRLKENYSQNADIQQWYTSQYQIYLIDFDQSEEVAFAYIAQLLQYVSSNNMLN